MSEYTIGREKPEICLAAFFPQQLTACRGVIRAERGAAYPPLETLGVFA
jgi:hypothetical protein